MNIYAYTRGDPVNASDPSGLQQIRPLESNTVSEFIVTAWKPLRDLAAAGSGNPSGANRPAPTEYNIEIPPEVSEFVVTARKKRAEIKAWLSDLRHAYGYVAMRNCPGGPAAVFAALGSEGTSAPGAPAVDTSKDITTNTLTLAGNNGNNSIIQTVNSSTMTITNFALPGHEFRGTVTLQVHQLGDLVAVSVSGHGDPAVPESPGRMLFNDAVGTAFFTAAAEFALDAGCGG